MEEREYFDAYERKLEELLSAECGSEGQLMTVEELDEAWHRMAPEYMADAIGQINRYPAFTLAVPAYAGMALAAFWDTDWKSHENVSYGELRDDGGFDTADEYILQNVLKLDLDSDEARRIEKRLRTMAHTAMTVIEHEEIEKATTKAFYILARTAKAMFRAGVSLELGRLGYKYERVNLGGSEKVN